MVSPPPPATANRARPLVPIEKPEALSLRRWVMILRVGSSETASFAALVSDSTFGFLVTAGTDVAPRPSYSGLPCVVGAGRPAGVFPKRFSTAAVKLAGGCWEWGRR